ncbi:MarR family transcriptional regulator [Pseudooceanicola onchidii]|uniref:MarR family transcriptional regulator n=1 Tax=Pseudooceanicola onchidii TaxID=2562279 RepID=UPI001F0FF0EB|nr:MarR family transcriptional regulator [Pseudooceanicola onchidii]
MPHSPPHSIVITGDIVGSTNLPPDRLSAGFEALEDAATRVAGWMRAESHFTRHRGDGWQLCLPDRLAPLRIALTLRAALRATDRRLKTRMALAVGAVQLPASGNLNDATGPAFVASGRLLDSLQGAALADARGGPHGAAAELAHHISDGWTQAQARSVLPMLAPVKPTQEDVAQSLGVTRQAVRQALVAAGYPAISSALDMLETP